MLLHKPDKTCKRLASCYKRAEQFAQKGDWKGHALSIMFSNALMLLDAKDDEASVDSKVSGKVYDMVILDWVAMKIDDYLKDHLIKDDQGLHAILFEWQSRLEINPKLLVTT